MQAVLTLFEALKNSLLSKPLKRGFSRSGARSGTRRECPRFVRFYFLARSASLIYITDTMQRLLSLFSV